MKKSEYLLSISIAESVSLASSFLIILRSLVQHRRGSLHSVVMRGPIYSLVVFLSIAAKRVMSRQIEVTIIGTGMLLAIYLLKL